MISHVWTVQNFYIINTNISNWIICKLEIGGKASSKHNLIAAKTNPVWQTCLAEQWWTLGAVLLIFLHSAYVFKTFHHLASMKFKSLSSNSSLYCTMAAKSSKTSFPSHSKRHSDTEEYAKWFHFVDFCLSPKQKL